MKLPCCDAVVLVTGVTRTALSKFLTKFCDLTVHVPGIFQL